MGITPALASAPCHNCRRQRLKCDRTQPKCKKCQIKSQDCLGYDRFLRWEMGIASRGRLMGKTFGADSSASSLKESRTGLRTSQNPSDSIDKRIGNNLSTSLKNPFVIDLDANAVQYLSYFATTAIKDYVLYDRSDSNTFRQLLPLAFQHPLLLQIIIANSAMHMSKSQRLSASHSTRSRNDALSAKQRALSYLKSHLESLHPSNIDIALASVLLFVELDLIDSGQDSWSYHVKGLNAIIREVIASDEMSVASMTPLRRSLMSESMVFDILGSAFMPSPRNLPGDTPTIGTISLLQDAEGNHCTSFPAILLQLIQAGSRLLGKSESYSSAFEARILLQKAEEFDAVQWATTLQKRSAAIDLLHRAHLAAADRAAVRIYLSRIALSLDPKIDLFRSFELLVAEIIDHISIYHPTDALFPAIVWSAFIAGAETYDNDIQAWIRSRFDALWEIESWGINKGALGLLESIWRRKRLEKTDLKADDIRDRGSTCSSWLDDIREEGVSWLII